MDPLQSAVVVVVIFIVVIVVIPIAIVTNTFGGTLNERKEMQNTTIVLPDCGIAVPRGTGFYNKTMPWESPPGMCFDQYVSSSKGRKQPGTLWVWQLGTVQYTMVLIEIIQASTIYTKEVQDGV